MILNKIIENASLITMFLCIVYVFLKVLDRLILLFIGFIEDSKYGLMCAKWIYLKKTGKELPVSAEKKFISKEDAENIGKVAQLINALCEEKIQKNKTKFSKLSHPFFLWYGKIFCKGNEGFAICVENGDVAKIRDEEDVESIEIMDNIFFIANAVDMAKKIKEKYNFFV